MNLITNTHFYAYFGNAEDNLRTNTEYDLEKTLRLQKKMEAKSGKALEGLFFLKQTHSADVFIFSEESQLKKPLTLFHDEGDAIITQQKNWGIGVVTADCVPIILYDSMNHAIGVIHAGWRGLSKKIISATITQMQLIFKTHPSHVQTYIGPSAGVCCYEVQDDFLPHFPDTLFKNAIAEKRQGKIFFNPQRAAYLELLDNHVLASLIDVSNNTCTICQPGFCSARNQKEQAGRQPSIVFLT